MELTTIFLYGMIIGLFFGFAFAIALDEIRLKRIMRALKKEGEGEKYKK